MRCSARKSASPGPSGGAPLRPAEREDDPLPEPAHARDAAPLDVGEGDVGGAEEERAPEAHAEERLPHDAGGEGLDVDLEVGQLGHPRILARERDARQPRARAPR